MPSPKGNTLPSCFKAYDIRGLVPGELDERLAFRIGLACADYLQARQVVVGRDVRLSSPQLAAALSDGLRRAGATVLDLGICGTEEVYFATAHQRFDGGIMVTASHNPAEYNGMKVVRRGAEPLSGEAGLGAIGKLVVSGEPQAPPARKGGFRRLDVRGAYINHLLRLVASRNFRPLRVVVNAGNGCAGPVVDRLAEYLPFTFVRLQWEPDGTFPNGIPNPLLPERRAETALAVREEGAALGIAWDGDFDRCFLFDERGGFIEGYYLVGMLAEHLLADRKGEKIIHDPRLVWSTEEVVRKAGGVPVQCKTGHAFIKERMRREDALYGGEMSGHHYFRDFFYCDSGMIPWLLICELLSRSGRSLSELVAERQRAYPVSGEINRRVSDPDTVLQRLIERYGDETAAIDLTDGVSIAFPAYRFNVRASNTEPVLRLNVESRGDPDLLARKTRELLECIDNY